MVYMLEMVMMKTLISILLFHLKTRILASAAGIARFLEHSVELVALPRTTTDMTWLKMHMMEPHFHSRHFQLLVKLAIIRATTVSRFLEVRTFCEGHPWKFLEVGACELVNSYFPRTCQLPQPTIGWLITHQGHGRIPVSHS